MYTQKKNIFKKPSIIQIIPDGPRDTFQIDITEIPKLLQTGDNCKYILSIIDQFSKLVMLIFYIIKSSLCTWVYERIYVCKWKIL